MENDFSIVEVRLIRSLLSCKTDEDIALILDRPVETVSLKIDELTGGKREFKNKKVARQLERLKEIERKAELKRQNRLAKELEVEQKRLKKQEAKSRSDWESGRQSKSSKVIASQNADREKRKRAAAVPLFKTKVVDYSEMRAVRIDQRTIIYAKHGEDPEAVKKKYLSNQKLPKNIAPAQRSRTVEVKKFKPL